ncbi:MAG: hypothetical protein UY04_C0043G0003 [Parcubacteria group bacterium GW2011_GWA2_47_7]|nr:MAG: hypothetical protein UY04_C0043G0003 [Parcubacteria group bacterium GW2011_GWA2_47_7]
MKKDRVPLVHQCLILLLLALAGGFAVLGAAHEMRREQSLLERELRDFIVPPITLKSMVYEVEDGRVTSDGREATLFASVRVLRIAHASVQNRLDPLFGMEGTDPHALAENVELLRASKVKIVARYSGEDRKILEQAFYPTVFLASLAQAEALAHTAYAYGRIPKTTFVFIAGESSLESYLSAFAQLKNTALKTKTALRKRARCAQRFSPDCPTLSVAFQKLHRLKTTLSASPAEVPPEILEHKLILNAARSSPQQPSQEVLVETSPGVCEGDTRGDPAYYEVGWGQGEVGERDRRVLFAYLNDIYFFDLAQADVLFLRRLKEKGARYSYRTIESFYMCPDIGGRYAELGTIAALRSSLQSSPLATESLGEAFSAAEAQVANGDVVRETDIGAYMAALSGILFANGEKESARLLGSEWVLRAESFLSMYRAQSGYFDAFVRSVNVTNRVINEVADIGLPYSASTLLEIRNFPLWFLLAYNKSVIEEAPQLLEATPWNGSAYGLVSFKDVLRNKYAPEEMLELLLEGKRIERRLYEEAALE